MSVTYVFDARTATAHFPGIGRYARALARHLPAQLAPGERLALLSREPDSPEFQPQSFEGAGVSGYAVDVSPFSLRQQWRIPQDLKRLDASVYHSPYYLMPYRPGTHALVTVFDLIPLQQPQAVSVQARLLFGLTMRLALRTARVVIVPSKATLQAVRARFGLRPENVRVIPLAAGPEFQPQPPAETARVRAAHGLSAEYVLYFGSNKPHKNLERLVQSWALLQGARPPVKDPMPLVIAGAWDPRYRASRHLSQRLGVDRSMRFLGPVPEADLPGLYSGAAIFVFPSLQEGFGLPVVEAMACGAPVICSQASSLPEVGGDAAVYIDPNRPENITAALVKVLDNQSLRAQLREKSLRQANAFSWVRTSRETVEVYREVLDASRGQHT